MNLPYNRISVNASLVKAIGMNESLLYEYLISSQNKGKWFWAPAIVIENRTSLSEHQQYTAFGNLAELGLVKTKLEGFPRRRYAKIRKSGFKRMKYLVSNQAIHMEKP